VAKRDPHPRDPHSKDSDAPSFEHSLEEVESIIEAIESGEVGLEKSLAEYERGVKLLKRCREILTSAEQRIESLSKDLKDSGDPDDE
jgi:exodeoxyribonuclease VII small subunit